MTANLNIDVIAKAVSVLELLSLGLYRDGRMVLIDAIQSGPSD